MTTAERLQASLYAFGAGAVKLLPEALLRPLARLAADFVYRRGGRGVRQLSRNLRRVVGHGMPDAEFAALVKAAMRSYARYWLEFFRLPVLGRDRILERMAIEGEEHLQAAMAAGRGAVLALPHTGNWDHAGAWVVLRGYPFTTVAERLKPETLFDRFVAVRERLGMEVLPLTGGDRSAFAVLLKRLREGKLVCLVSERDLGDTGVDVDFFGERTTMPGGPASLAVATGAVLLPATLWFTEDGGPGGGWGARVHPPVAVPADADKRAKVAAMTQATADAFAEGIAAHPQDWHMLQPLWPADRRRRAADSAEPVLESRP